MRHRILSTALCLALATGVGAQTEAQREDVTPEVLALVDTIMMQEKIRQAEDAITQYNRMQMRDERRFNFDGCGTLLRGLIMVWADKKTTDNPAYFPKIATKRDDLIHYVPAVSPLAATWILKAAGVPSRSKLRRMVTANAISLALTVGLGETLKYTTHEMRPDQSDDRSFPSGHSAIAFASATILAREYGYISPWITVGSYATATGTQLLRINKNKHWMNDLVVGAGLGMVATNLGYFISDCIFGENGIRPFEIRRKDLIRLAKFQEHPSGLNFVSGSEVGSLTLSEGAYTNLNPELLQGCDIKTTTALSVGADLSWFWNEYFGAEAIVRYSSAQAKVYGSNQTTFTGDVLNMLHTDVAFHASLPVGTTRMGAKVMAGTRYNNGFQLSAVDATNPSVLTPAADIPSQTRFELGAGIQMDALATKNHAVGLSIEYYHAFTKLMPNRINLATSWRILF